MTVILCYMKWEEKYIKKLCGDPVFLSFFNTLVTFIDIVSLTKSMFPIKAASLPEKLKALDINDNRRKHDGKLLCCRDEMHFH